jgi:hypothetical protein
MAKSTLYSHHLYTNPAVNTVAKVAAVQPTTAVAVAVVSASDQCQCHFDSTTERIEAQFSFATYCCHTPASTNLFTRIAHTTTLYCATNCMQSLQLILAHTKKIARHFVVVVTCGGLFDVATTTVPCCHSTLNSLLMMSASAISVT